MVSRLMPAGVCVVLGAVLVTGVSCHAENVEVIFRNTTDNSAEFNFQPLTRYPVAASEPVTQLIESEGQSKPILLLPEAPQYQLRRTAKDGGQRVFTIDLLAFVKRAQEASGKLGPVEIDYRELARTVREPWARSVEVTKYRSEERTRDHAVTRMVPETKTRSVTVTRYRSEARTRTVRKYDPTLRRDVDMEETYYVQVPYTKQVEQAYKVMVPVTEEQGSTYTVQVPYTDTVVEPFMALVPVEETFLAAPGAAEAPPSGKEGPEVVEIRLQEHRVGSHSHTEQWSLGVGITDGNGALVSKVTAGSPASRLRRSKNEQEAEMRPYALVANHDRILMVNDESVTTADEADAAIKRSERKCRLLVQHGLEGIAEWYDVELDLIPIK